VLDDDRFALQARCDIRERSWSPTPRPATCELNWGQGLFVGREAAGFVCAGDTTFEPGARVEPYGNTVRLGELSCDVTENGVTCRDDHTTHGFFLNRDEYRFF
jgi:uncharacterized protein DUF6636